MSEEKEIEQQASEEKNEKAFQKIYIYGCSRYPADCRRFHNI